MDAAGIDAPARTRITGPPRTDLRPPRAGQDHLDVGALLARGAPARARPPRPRSQVRVVVHPGASGADAGSPRRALRTRPADAHRRPSVVGAEPSRLPDSARLELRAACCVVDDSTFMPAPAAEPRPSASPSRPRARRGSPWPLHDLRSPRPPPRRRRTVRDRRRRSARPRSPAAACCWRSAGRRRTSRGWPGQAGDRARRLRRELRRALRAARPLLRHRIAACVPFSISARMPRTSAAAEVDCSARFPISDRDDGEPAPAHRPPSSPRSTRSGRGGSSAPRGPSGRRRSRRCGATARRSAIARGERLHLVREAADRLDGALEHLLALGGESSERCATSTTSSAWRAAACAVCAISAAVVLVSATAADCRLASADCRATPRSALGVPPSCADALEISPERPVSAPRDASRSRAGRRSRAGPAASSGRAGRRARPRGRRGAPRAGRAGRDEEDRARGDGGGGRGAAGSGAGSQAARGEPGPADEEDAMRSGSARCPRGCAKAVRALGPVHSEVSTKGRCTASGATSSPAPRRPVPGPPARGAGRLLPDPALRPGGPRRAARTHAPSARTGSSARPPTSSTTRATVGAPSRITIIASRCAARAPPSLGRDRPRARAAAPHEPPSTHGRGARNGIARDAPGHLGDPRRRGRAAPPDTLATR